MNTTTRRAGVNASSCLAKDVHDGGTPFCLRGVPAPARPLHPCTGQSDCEQLLETPGRCRECTAIAKDCEADACL